MSNPDKPLVHLLKIGEKSIPSRFSSDTMKARENKMLIHYDNDLKVDENRQEY